MKIDWNKPLREVGDEYSSTRICLGKDPTLDIYWVRHVADEVHWAYAYKEDGTPLILGSNNLENVPQKPDREEGAYVVSAKGTIALFGFLAGDWYERGKKVDAPDRVIERWYSELEYRPADKCPPPIDGTPFEVDGFLGLSFKLSFCGDPHWRVSNGDFHWFRWIRDKSWRPVQP